MPAYKVPCPRCGQFIMRDVAVCPFCQAKDPFAPIRCASCNAVIEDARWTACPQCGTAVPGRSQPAAAAPAQGQQAAPASGAPVNSGPAGQSSSAPASAAAAPAATSAPQATPAPAAPASQRFCTGCGSPLTAGARFCNTCGTLAG